MKYPEYKDKKVLVFGLGTYGNGPAAIKFFHENGAQITVTDLKTEDQLKSSLEQVKHLHGIKYVLGKNDEADFMQADIIFRSPAIPNENELLKKARGRGVQILMAEALFMKHFGTKNVIGVTGTKGKTTTATLCYELLLGLGFKTCLAGVPTRSALELLLNDAPQYDKIVLEISSWDCEGLDELEISPSIAIITDIAEDHLNRYANSMKAYAMSKASLFKYQKPDNYLIMSEYNLFKSDYIPYCKSIPVIFDYQNNYAVDLKNMAKYNFDSDLFANAKLLGEHNKKNLWSAFCVALTQGFDQKKSLEILNNFSAVEGRLQNIGQIGQAYFINDTCATAPIAAIASMDIFKDKNAVFIFGGYDKSLDYKDLVNYIIRNKIEYVLLKGTATDKMIHLGLDKSEVFDNFKLAVESALRRVKNNQLPRGKPSGYAVLNFSLNHMRRKAARYFDPKIQNKEGYVVLSPGAASFGMFENEFDRGHKFVHIFEELKNDHKN